jgi:hypothetical protein
MQITKSPIYQSAWSAPVEIRVIEVTDCADIRALASPYGATAVSLDTTPYFFEGIGQELELINPSPVLREIKQYGHPGVRSIVGYTIDRATLKPGEEAFWTFYLKNVVPACIGSNKRGEQKRLRDVCLKALYANESLVDFICHVVLPGEDMSKPGAIKKLFNNTFSTRTIEHDLTDFRKTGQLPTTFTTPDRKPPVKAAMKAKEKEKEKEKSKESIDEQKSSHHAQEARDVRPHSVNSGHSVTRHVVPADAVFIEPDSGDDTATPRHQQHIADLMNKALGIRRKK